MRSVCWRSLAMSIWSRRQWLTISSAATCGITRHGYPAERALALSALFLVLVIEQMLVGFLVTMRHPLGAVAAGSPISAPPRGDGAPPHA